MWEQRSEKEIARTNKLFEDLGLEAPEVPGAFSSPKAETSIQFEDEHGRLPGDPSEAKLKRCPVSDKVCFISQAKAEQAAKRRQEHAKVGFLRVYQCPDCYHYHLTSGKPKPKSTRR